MRILAWASNLRAVLTVFTAITALYIGLVTLGNISDFNTNHAFVEHVLTMDTTSGSPSTRWRAITDQRLITAAYLAIIVWESLITIVLTIAFFYWLRAITVQRAAVVACQLSICGWLMQIILFGGGFMAIGGEWFQMWQSSKWNGMQPALQNFLIASLGLILAHLSRPDSPNDTQSKSHRITPA